MLYCSGVKGANCSNYKTNCVTLQAAARDWAVQATPMPERQNLNLLTNIGLVKLAAIIWSVLQYTKQASLQETLSLAKWYMITICFDVIEAIDVLQ